VHAPALVSAARRAAFVAADSVRRKGTQSSYPSRADLPAALFDTSTDGEAWDGLPVPVALHATVPGWMEAGAEAAVVAALVTALPHAAGWATASE
jgi:hypothetical protein